MASVHDVANYILHKGSQVEGVGNITNLKLQKLVYYVQGFHTVMLEKPAFDERMEAWLHGPVVPDLYHRVKAFGNSPISVPEDFDEATIDEQSAELIDEVLSVYGSFSAWQLRNLTHEETPWLKNYDEETGANEIPLRDLEEFFPTLLE